ncbi:MAG: hypothetical protein JXD23_03565 [Spirochaetales bacterium]|nr:hypothetical protein [Spirochaetales bacterium]
MGTKKSFPAVSALIPAAALAAAFSLCGCASTPITAKDVPAGETMFVVPGVVIDAQTSRYQGDFGYNLNLENVETGRAHIIYIRASSLNGYAYRRGLPEGQYRVKSYVPRGFRNEDEKPLYIQRRLTLRKGVLAVLPVKVVITIFNPSIEESDASVRVDFWEIGEKEEARILEFVNSGQAVPRPTIELVKSVPLFSDPVDWLKHFNFTAGATGPYWTTTDGNLYSVGLVDSVDGTVYSFSRDVSRDPIFPVSISASLRIPVFYEDTWCGGVSFDFNLVPAKTVYSGTLGAFVGYKLKPFTFYAEGGVSLALMYSYVSGLTGDATFYGVPYPAGTEMFIFGSSPPSVAVGAGVKWQMSEWLFLKLRYIYQFPLDIKYYEYHLGNISVRASGLQDVLLPQHTITFGLGVGLN